MSNTTLKPPIRELLCQRCEQEYPTWFTHNDTWNQVCRVGKEIQFLCPNCFLILAAPIVGKVVWAVRIANSETSEAMQEALDSIPIYNRPHTFRPDRKSSNECMTCDRHIKDTIHI